MLNTTIDAIRKAYSGQVAKDDVMAITRHHRIQASPGYRAAAEYVLEELKKAGLEATIETYPADFQSKFWTAGSFQEWQATSATLHLIEPAGEARKLADYREMKLSLIQRSVPFQGEAEVVVLEDGLIESDYEGLDVAGKVVLTRGQVGRVHQFAVEQHGALGIIFDGMSAAPPVREAMDLPDARQYTSFWWTGKPGEKLCFGFVLSPRQGKWLRNVIRTRETAGQGPVRVRAEVVSDLYDGEMEVVEAVIPGRSVETVLVVSHLCHPQPSANDNGSGVAANMEAARTLHRLIQAGALPSPLRTIRFLWMPEMTGSYAYLSRHEDEIPNMVAGLNLDMVGEDQNQTGSVLLIEQPPEAMASFTSDLLEKLRELIYDDVHSYTGLSRYSLHRYATTKFSGGSDHFIFSDPAVGVPMPMLIQWPDKFYHTSADTVDKVSADSLARAGSLASAYAYFIANAHETEAIWLAHEKQTRFQARLTKQIQGWVTAKCHKDGGNLDLEMLKRQVSYRLDRHLQALSTIGRLWSGIGPLTGILHQDATLFAEQELTRAEGIIESVPGSGTAKPTGPGNEVNGWEHKALGMIPRRLYRGPYRAIGGLTELSTDERAAWIRLLFSRKGGFTMSTLAEYWADGRRNALEIVDLVEMEMGIRDAELIVCRFELLQKLGMVEF